MNQICTANIDFVITRITVLSDKLLTSVLSAIISAAETGSTALPVDSS